MFLLIILWLVVAIILVAMDVTGSVRKTEEKRSRLGRAAIWGFALGLMVFAIFWFA